VKKKQRHKGGDMYTTMGKQGLNLARAWRPWLKFEWAIMLGLWVASWFAMSVVPFMRSKFGERYLSWLNLYFGYGVVAGFMFIGPFMMPFTGGEPHYWLGIVSVPMLIAWALFIVFSLAHRYRIWRRNRKGEAWHSYAMGDSAINAFLASGGFEPIPDEWIHKWIEPLAVMVVGVLFVTISRSGDPSENAGVVAPVGVWLVISSICLFVHSRIIYFYERQQFLDIQDAQIQAKHYRDALAGKPAAKTGGFVIAHSTVRAVERDAGLKAAFEALGDDMRSLLTAA